MKSFLKKIIPEKLFEFLKSFYYFFLNKYKTYYYRFFQFRYKKIVRQVRKKDKIKVAFFLIHEAVWKYEGVYRLMEKDERFDPVVIICPYILYGETTMFKEMDQAYNSFFNRGYHVISTYDKNSKKWLDIKEMVDPDIVFFTNPHPLTKDEYYIGNFPKTLTCYVPYTFQTTYHYNQNYNRFFHNVLWKAYYQTDIHKKIAAKYAMNRAKNVVVTGYPGIDGFLKEGEYRLDKKRTDSKKKIIWAPHHTIEGEGMDLNFSNFLRYHGFIIELAKEYRHKIFITFKPHPNLRPKLNKIWGQEKTDRYYKFWQENDFCALNEGDYQKLFIESDAMIHDCDSFLGEYLALNKPVLYTDHDNHVKDRLNEFGKPAFDMHYHAKNEREIMNFIVDVVLNEDDRMEKMRENWVKKYIIPPNSKKASVNIFVDLKNSLEIGE